MRCPGCGHENPPDAGFCGECGTVLASEAECPSCGRANDAGQRFCHGCGHRLGGSEAAELETDSRTYTPKHLADKILLSRSALEGERKQIGLCQGLVGDWEDSARTLEEARQLAEERRTCRIYDAAILTGLSNARLGLGDSKSACRLAGSAAVSVARNRHLADEAESQLALLRGLRSRDGQKADAAIATGHADRLAKELAA